VTLTYHALWMLCALGTVVFATAAAAHVRPIAALAAGLIAGIVWWSPARVPDAAETGFLTSLAAALYLFRPRLRLVTAAFGGALAGMLAALVEMYGITPALSPLAGIALVAVSIWLARTRPSFAPELLRDEAMLMIGLVGLSVAILPGVMDGWQAATNLAAATDRVATASLPMWTLLLLLMTSSCGAFYSVWSRR
jgi:hypothetical protein